MLQFLAAAKGTGCHVRHWAMQEISIVSGLAPTVHRPDGSARLYLTFEGLRESRTIADKLTRVQVVLRIAEARRLQELLAEHLATPG